MSDNKDLVKRVYDDLNSLAPGMPYTEESLGRNLKKEGFAKDIFKFASDRFGANLLGAPNEKSFLDSLGLNKPVNTMQEAPKQTESEKTPVMESLQVGDPTRKMETSMFKTPDLSITVPDSLQQRRVPFNPEQSFNIKNVIGETPQERIQAEINNLGEDAVMDSAKVGLLKEDIQKQIAGINKANEKFLKEYEANLRDTNVNSENMHHDSWSPMMPWNYKKNKEAGEYIKQNSERYDRIQKQKQALQRQYDLLETYGQYADFGRSVEVGKRLSAMVGSGAISEDTMKILRSKGSEKAKDEYLVRLLNEGKIDKETAKEIYNLGDLTEKNGLGYGLFKTGKAADMLTFGVNEIARDMDIANIANRVNAGEEVSAEEMDVLNMYLKLGKIKEKAQKDFGFWFNAGMGMQESLRFMAEMALTGGAGTLGKQLGVQGAKALIQQFGMKSAIKTLAKNVGEVALKSAGKQALLTPLTPSAYRHFSERLTGLAVEGEDISGWDKVGELYKSYAQTFAERFSESLGNIASDVPLWTMLTKGKATRDLTNIFVRTFAEISDSEAFKQSAEILKNVGIAGIPEEVLSELSGTLMTAALTFDSEALKESTDPNFYGQVALQSAIMGGMGGVVNYTVGGIGSAIHNKKMKDQYERSMNALNSTSFNHQALEDLRLELMDAMSRQDYVNEDESAQQRPVADIIRDMNTIFETSTVTHADARAMDIADNAVRTGAYRYGEQQAIKSYVEGKIGAFENTDGNVYEVTDTDGTNYFILDSTDDTVVLHNRNTGEKEVKRKDHFQEGSIKQTNGNDWAMNEFLLNINNWNQEKNTQEQVKGNDFVPATHIDFNGNVVPVKSYDPQTGKYTIADEQGNEVEVSGTDEGVIEIWGTNPQTQTTNTENTSQEVNTADSTEDNTNVTPEAHSEVETPSNEQISTEGVTGEETAEPTEENIEYDEKGDPVWNKISPERGKQEIDSAFDEDEAKAFVADKIKAAEKAVKAAEKKKPKSGNIRDRKAEIEQIKAEREQAKANLDYWNAMSNLYNAQPVAEVAEETPVAQTEPVFKNTSDSVLQEGVTPYTVGENIKQRYNDAPKAYGAEDTYIDADGNTYKGRWVVTEADAVTPSHNAETLQPNEGFPVTDKGRNVNDNDYSNKAGIVETMAANYDARALDEPVIVSEGAIISGNNRTISGQIAAVKGTDTKYKEALPTKAAMRGVSAEELSKFKNPRLVFELAEPIEYTTETFAKFNRPRSKTKSPVDMAIAIGKQDTSRLVGQVLSTIGDVEKLSELYQNQNKVAEIMKQVVESGIINQNEMPQFYSQEYGITDAGKDFIETLLIGSVINEDQIRILNSEGMKQYREKIVSAMIPIAKNMKFEDNIGNRLNTAIKYLKEARDAKTDLKGILLDNPIFDAKEYEDLTIFTALMLQRKPSEFRDFINNLNDRLSLGGENLFGEQETAQSVLEDYKQQNKLTDNERETIRLAEQTRNSATQSVYGGVQADGTNADNRGEGVDGSSISETEKQSVENGQTEVQSASGDTNIRDDRGADAGVRYATESDSKGRPGENVQRKHFKREIDGESNGGGVSEISGETSLSNNSDVEEAINEISKKLNTPVNVYHNRKELEAAGHYDVIEALNNGLMPKGWYNDNEVGVYLPNIDSTKDAEAVLIHEIVAHKGIKGLLGEDANTVYDAVWNGMSQDDKITFLRYAYMQYFNDFTKISKREWIELFPSYETLEDLRRDAADEYIAHLSAKVDFTDAEKVIWQRFVDTIRRFIKAISSKSFTTKDIEQLLRASYSKLVQDPSGNVINPRHGSAFKIVDDSFIIDELESSPKKTGFRNVVLNLDGTFGSPMANELKVKGQEKIKTSPFELGKWEQAEENPHLVNENGKITLVKPSGKTVDDVDYNPYIHNRLNAVNAQFKDAWQRPDLVYIETEVPITDLESGYQADKAAKPVGIHKWSNGALMLSRYDKPVRILPWSEVADDWVERFKDRGVEFDIVPPALLPILTMRGVNILPPHKGMGKACNDAYAEWQKNPLKKKEGIISDEQIEQLNKQYGVSRQENQEQIAQADTKGNVGRTAEHKQALFDKAKEVFGTTNNFKVAGYMLPDGSLLDFSGRWEGGPGDARYTDHRAIGSGLYEASETDSNYDTNMYDFINQGAIRLMPESAGIYVSQPLTEKQEDRLASYIYRNNGEVILEITDKDGNSISYIEYNRRTSPDKVLSDINNYFEKGIKPVQPEVRFRLADGPMGARQHSEEVMRESIDKMAQDLGVNAEYVSDEKQLDKKGWYDPTTGKVYVNLAAHATIDDARATYLHEVVGHFGLRGLLKDKFEKVMNDVFNSLPKELQTELLGKYKNDKEVAAEEYLASMIESDIEPSLVEKILGFIREAIRSIGINLDNYTNGDLEYLLWRSKNNLRENAGKIEAAQWGAKNKEARYRSINRPAGYKTNTLEMSFTDKLLHSIQDRMRPVKKIMDEVINRGGVIDETSDPHSQEFLSASRAAAEIEDFKFSRYEPLAKAIADAMKVFTEKFGMTAEDARTAVNEYLYARHAPERNKRICVNEIVEAGLKMVAPKDAALVNETFKAELRRLAEQLYDNQFRGGKSTITPTGLSAEQTRLAMILAVAMQNKTTAISKEQAKDEDTGTMVLVANNRSGMSDAEAEEVMNKFYTAETKAALDEVSARVKDCTNFTLDKWLEYGLISRDEYNAYQNQYEYYIPLRGWEEKGEDIDYLEIPSKQFNQASELINLNRYAKGRLSKAADPLAYIASLAQSACVTGNRNLIRQMAFNMVAQNERLMADLAVIENTYEIYDDEGNPIGQSKTAPSQALFDQGRVKVIANKDYRWHKTGSELGAHRVPVMIDGVRHTIYFKGTLGALAATAINGTDNDTRNVLMQGAAKTTRFISANLTARNIAFLTKNIIRDLGFGNFAYFVENGFKDAWKLKKEFFSAMKTAAMDAMGADKSTYADSALYDEFKMNGGQTGYVHLDDLNKLSKEMNRMIEEASNNKGVVAREAKNAKDVLVQTFDVLGKASENAMRFAVYKMERQRGASPREAAIRAKEITVNFNRQGKNTKYFSSVYAFFNPAVQGAYRFGNLIINNPKRATTSLLALVAIKFGLGMICEMFSGGDDDEPKGESAYDRLSDYVKATNWVIPLGWLPGESNDDKFLCIPLPQSVRAITHISDMVVDMVYGRKTYLEAMIENALFSAGEFLPFDIDAIDLSSDNPWGTILQAASPTLARPIVENILNRDFMGNPITKEPFVQSQDYIPQYQLAFRTTSPILVGTSKFLNELAGGDELRSAKYQISENGQVEESALGSFMDVNPAKMEHLFSGYFGGMFNPLIEVYDTMRGMTSKDIETQIESVSIANQFVKGPTSKPGYKKFYDMRDEAQNITNMNNLYKEEYRNENYRPLKSNRFNMEIAATFKAYNDVLKVLNNNIALLNSNSSKVDNYNEKRKELEEKRDALILEAATKYREICERRDKQMKDNTDEKDSRNRN